MLHLFNKKKCESFLHNLNTLHLQAKTPDTLCFLCAAYETAASRPHFALFTCLFLLMSCLGVAMYCTDRRRPQRACEELEAVLAVYLLHMKQILWGCWIWLTMQWHWAGWGMDSATHPHTLSPPFIRTCFFPPLWRCPGLQTPQTSDSGIHLCYGINSSSQKYVASMFVYIYTEYTHWPLFIDHQCNKTSSAVKFKLS